MQAPMRVLALLEKALGLSAHTCSALHVEYDEVQTTLRRLLQEQLIRCASTFCKSN